jgi:hypothetical protein
MRVALGFCLIVAQATFVVATPVLAQSDPAKPTAPRSSAEKPPLERLDDELERSRLEAERQKSILDQRELERQQMLDALDGKRATPTMPAK